MLIVCPIAAEEMNKNKNSILKGLYIVFEWDKIRPILRIVWTIVANFLTQHWQQLQTLRFLPAIGVNYRIPQSIACDIQY